jgi:hypothetical protein
LYLSLLSYLCICRNEFCISKQNLKRISGSPYPVVSSSVVRKEPPGASRSNHLTLDENAVGFLSAPRYCAELFPHRMRPNRKPTRQQSIKPTLPSSPARSKFCRTGNEGAGSRKYPIYVGALYPLRTSRKCSNAHIAIPPSNSHPKVRAVFSF